MGPCVLFASQYKRWWCFAEWRHGRAGRVTLSDEDRTTVTGAGGWRGLNTLAHYGVRDAAVMALIPRQNDSFSSNCKSLFCLLLCSVSLIFFLASGMVETAGQLAVSVVDPAGA